MADDFFKTEYTKAADGSGRLFDEQLTAADQPVSCLGMSFPNDAARRAYFTEELRKKLQDPEFRKIEGFPIGKDEDILALSDPPYYCACPNPWIGDFIREWEQEKPPKDDLFHYLREPFAADVSEGKNDPIYNAHSYHTKVPHKAIMRYILHYTEPGDIVFDGFCGTGMTGVAAQMCGDIEQVRSLGYRVDEKTGNIYDPQAEDPTKPISKLGARKAILNDLSPAATFIANIQNHPFDSDIIGSFEDFIIRFTSKYDEYYVTKNSFGVAGHINYTVWSDVFICPNCMHQLTAWQIYYNEKPGAVNSKLICPHCKIELARNDLKRATKKNWNGQQGMFETSNKTIPVLINLSCVTKRMEKIPDEKDLSVLKEIDATFQNPKYPTTKIMFVGAHWGDTWRAGIHSGIERVDHFYSLRTLFVLSAFLNEIPKRFNWLGQFILGAILPKLTKMNRYMPQHGSRALVGPMANTLYLPPLYVENNVCDQLRYQWKKIKQVFLRNYSGVTGTQASQKFSSLHQDSMDYIFLDPPFGANIMYSELSFLREAWLKLFTNNKLEAIQNNSQQKDLSEYRTLMTTCFKECHRLLKPGRWLTVEFSNTSSAIWNSIRDAIKNAGFIIANVTNLDKSRGGLQAIIGTTAVKQDLIISAYKPNGGFEERFITEVDTEEGIWDFVRTHLKYLPVAKIKGGRLVTVGERDPRRLFDLLVAYYVRKGFDVPISSQDFQQGLSQRFDERDGLYYLPEQAAEYDKKKAMTPELVTGDLFVSDEASAIAWLRKLLKARTLTFQEINPLFMQELTGWNKHEVQLELLQLLEENFLMYDGTGEVPSQIHTYLSSNWHDLRDLAKDDPRLVDKAMNRWYVPDPNKAGDLEKLREKSLLREFEEYRNATKKLKTFRLEAIRAGFKHAFQERDYATILAVGKKIPEDVLEEDEKLLMWFNQAEMRMEE